MGKTDKKETRRKFREAVFKRDRYRCVVCGFVSSPERAEQELDAHHVTPREQLPHGGYVPENGVSLCDPSKTGQPFSHGCHYRAEQVLQGGSTPESPEDPDYEFSPAALYAKIGSSYEKAHASSERLK